MRQVIVLAAAVVALGGSALAQELQDRKSPGAASSGTASHGEVSPQRVSPEWTAARRISAAPALNRADGAWVGAGDHYVVRFDERSIEFDPVLRGDYGDARLRLSLESVQRGEAAPQAVAAGKIRAKGLRLEVVRDLCVERYDVRAEHVKQSFVFDKLPTGEGDLVLRLALDSKLEARASTSGGIELCSGDDALIKIGVVVGYDAAGRRCEGSLCEKSGVIEMRLPEDFVSTAKLPLTVDPPIGTNIFFAGSADRRPRVAFDATYRVYLVVWERASSTRTQVFAQRFDTSGRKRFNGVVLSTSGGRPRVANLNLRNAFVVVWTTGSSLVARSVGAGNTALSRANTLTSDVRVSFDVAGESTTRDDDVLLVWRNRANRAILAAQVQVSATGVFRVFAPKTLFSSSSSVFEPVISRSGGPEGRFLIAWRFGSSAIRGAVVDRNLNVLDGAVSISSSATVPEAIAGDGRTWLVTYTRGSDIFARSVQFHVSAPGLTSVGPEQVVEAQPNDTERGSSATFVGGSVLVPYLDRTSGRTTSSARPSTSIRASTARRSSRSTRIRPTATWSQQRVRSRGVARARLR